MQNRDDRAAGRRSGPDRRSGVDTRSKEEQQRLGERRTAKTAAPEKIEEMVAKRWRRRPAATGASPRK